MKKLLLILMVLLVTAGAAFAAGQKEKEESYTLPEDVKAQGTVTFWHAMSGSKTAIVDGYAEEFMKRHPEITVEAVYSGSYAETVTKGLAAIKAGKPPVLLMSYEVGTQTMLDSGAIIPIHTLNKGEIDFDDVTGPIAKYYSVNDNLNSMPFNSSTAMIYYNKDMFRAAGLDPDKPPTSFDEVYEYSKKIMDAGLASGGISFGWPAWIFEQMHAYHNVFYANNDNGRSGERASEVLFNGKLGVEVLTEWQKWAKAGVLAYGGRTYKANDPFIAGEFAMLVQSTSSLAGIIKTAEFEVGTAFLPRLPGYEKGNSVIGGASIWLLKGHSDGVNAAAWKFLQYLFEEQNAVAWHKGTGYFPVNNKAYGTLMNEGWFDKEPRFRTAFDQILGGSDSKAASGVLLGNFVEIRDIMGAAIEDVVVNMKDPKTILDKAKIKCDRVLSDYISTVE